MQHNQHHRWVGQNTPNLASALIPLTAEEREQMLRERAEIELKLYAIRSAQVWGQQPATPKPPKDSSSQ